MSPLPSYRHTQVYTMLWLLVPLSAAITGGSLIVANGDGAAVGAAVGAAGLALPLLFLGRLVIELRGDQLHWGFGWLPWPRWQVALAEIEGVERTRAAARHGSGIQGRRGDRLYNVTIGGPAVLLRLRGGRRITLGTPEAERLAAFIEARLQR